MSAVKLSDFEHKFGNPSDILHDALSGSFLEASKVMTPNGLKVYLDGAGSGGAVVDAFAHLSAPDITVDDDLIVGDKNALLIATRILGYGKDYEFMLNNKTET